MPDVVQRVQTDVKSLFRAVLTRDAKWMQAVCARFHPMRVHAALLAVPFSDDFEADVSAALQQSGLPDMARTLTLTAGQEGVQQCKQSQGCVEAIAVACLVERSGSAFACCAWLYVAVIEQCVAR